MFLATAHEGMKVRFLLEADLFPSYNGVWGGLYGGTWLAPRPWEQC